MAKEFLETFTDRAKLLELLSMRESGARREVDEKQMNAALKERVRGQDHVVDDLCRLIKLQWAKEKRRRPIANLLFLGPTGTGKSELAKAVAEHLFGDEKSCLVFDGPDFSGPEGKNRLIGVPGGYVDSDKGGALTRPLLQNPRRLVVFEEVEKAWSGIFDLFLSLMGDGRLNEASGKSADFTQSIVVLTSNAEHEAISRIQNEIADYHEMVNAIKGHLADTKVFRPEVIGRFDRVYVFKPLSGIVKAEIAAQKARTAAREYGLELKWIDPNLLFDVLVKSDKLDRFGIRELERIVNEMLGEGFVAARASGIKRVRVDFDEAGEPVVGAAEAGSA